MRFLLIAIFILWIYEYEVSSLNFELGANSQRCLREAVDKDVIVIGEFDVTSADGLAVNYVVYDSKGQILSKNENVHNGKFTFSTEVQEVFEVCFTSKVMSEHHPSSLEVRLNIKSGVEAKSYDQLMETGKLKPLEIELRKIEDLSESILKDFENMKRQEARMSNTNESTNTRVFYLSIFIMLFLVAVAAWQVFYLHSYFKSRKLID